MTTQYAYRLIPESSVPASARSTARGALALAAELEGISRPTLLWFLPADRPGHQVFRESPRPLAGWTERDRIYLAADLPDREVWETVGHECAHIYAAWSREFGSPFELSTRQLGEPLTEATSIAFVGRVHLLPSCLSVAGNHGGVTRLATSSPNSPACYDDIRPTAKAVLT